MALDKGVSVLFVIRSSAEKLTVYQESNVEYDQRRFIFSIIPFGVHILLPPCVYIYIYIYICIYEHAQDVLIFILGNALDSLSSDCKRGCICIS